LSGGKQFVPASELLLPECGNLHSILSIALQEGTPPHEFALALFEYTIFLCMTGHYADLLKQLLKKDKWDQELDSKLKAKTLNYLAVLYLGSGQYGKASAASEVGRKFSVDSELPSQATISL
jgi:hypothetical protein